MTNPRSLSRRGARSLALRIDRTSENRFTLALILLLSLATASVLATTSSPSWSQESLLPALSAR